MPGLPLNCWTMSEAYDGWLSAHLQEDGVIAGVRAWNTSAGSMLRASL
jgi:hypothetical protein